MPSAAGAFGVFFLRQFFLADPDASWRRARCIDGAEPWRTIFIRIVLPNARPALATSRCIVVPGQLERLHLADLRAVQPERLTLPVGLTMLQGAYTIDYPVIMAGAAMASVPVLLLYIFVQRYVIEGVASSGIKG